MHSYYWIWSDLAGLEWINYTYGPGRHSQVQQNSLLVDTRQPFFIEAVLTELTPCHATNTESIAESTVSIGPVDFHLTTEAKSIIRKWSQRSRKGKVQKVIKFWSLKKIKKNGQAEASGFLSRTSSDESMRSRSGLPFCVCLLTYNSDKITKLTDPCKSDRLNRWDSATPDGFQ